MRRTRQPERPATESRIPDFKSREEEAEFWDTHDITDFLDELRPVKVRFAKNLSEGMTIRFEPEMVVELRQRAKQKGIGPTTLVRMWVLERLEAEKKAASP